MVTKTFGIFVSVTFSQCMFHATSLNLARHVLDYGKAMLGTVSALSLTALGGSGGSDEKLKEEKQKTEAERKKNGTLFYFVCKVWKSAYFLYLAFQV